MAEHKALSGSQLLAVWPGMGHVALTAGFYLMSKLHMHEEAPLDTEDLFDLDHVDVQKGLARAGHVPISHLYAINDARRGSDLGLVIGEAQPPLHKMEYCRRILDGASRLGVSQVVTFAALASDLHPRDPSVVYGVATHPEGIDSLARHKIETLETGQINGMNGVFLAASAQRGIPAICLLGTMPAFAARIPYPKASHAVLQAFASLCGMEVELGELQEYGRGIEEQLTKGLEKIQEVLETDPEAGSAEEKDEPAPEAAPAAGPSEAELQRIETLFEQAVRDRSKSFELKRELDRLDVFRKYENRFLDLFRKRRPE